MRSSLLKLGGICLIGLLGSASAGRAEEAAPRVRFTVDTPSEPESAVHPAPSIAPVDAPAVSPEEVISALWAAEFELQTDAIQIRWKPFPGAIRYFVEVAADPGRQQPLWIGTSEAPEARVPLGGFVPRGPIYVRFRAVNASAEELSSFVTSSILGRQIHHRTHFGE